MIFFLTYVLSKKTFLKKYRVKNSSLRRLRKKKEVGDRTEGDSDLVAREEYPE